MTDYVTLHINKRFLGVVLLLSLIVGGGYGLHRYSYKKGISDAVAYFYQQLQASKSLPSGQSNNPFAPDPTL
jgi:hypothetical protein